MHWRMAELPCIRSAYLISYVFWVYIFKATYMPQILPKCKFCLLHNPETLSSIKY